MFFFLNTHRTIILIPLKAEGILIEDGTDLGVIAGVQVRVNRLSTQFLSRIVQNVNHILSGALDTAVRVDLEQRPADVAYVVLDRLEISRLLRRMSVDGRLG